MNINLGNLNFVSALEFTELLAKPVADALSASAGAEGVGVAEIDANLSDTESFCDYYKVDTHQAANCVILEATEGDKNWLAACVILGSAKADVNGAARRALCARRVSFAPMETAVRETKMERGAITPLGLPKEWPILIDKAVANSEYVIIGSGIRGSKLAVSGSFLASLPNATVVEGLSKANGDF